jgi:hypothetical protein
LPSSGVRVTRSQESFLAGTTDARGRPLANILNITGLKDNSAKGHANDHEGLLVLLR